MSDILTYGKKAHMTKRFEHRWINW